MDDQIDSFQHFRTRQIGKLFELLKQFRFRPENTDVVLICNGKWFPAHKLLLMASSPYFETFFSSTFPEAKLKEVKLDMDDDVMEFILDYLYSQNQVQDFADLQHAARVLQMAHFLEINELFEICCSRIGKLASAEDFQFLVSLNTYEHPCITDMLRQVAKSHFRKIFSGKLVASYTFQEVGILIDMALTNNFKYVEEVIDGFIKWLDDNNISFIQHLNDFINLAHDCNMVQSLIRKLDIPSEIVSLIHRNPNKEYDSLIRSMKILQFDDHGCTQGVFRTWSKNTKISRSQVPFKYTPDMKFAIQGHEVYLLVPNDFRCVFKLLDSPVTYNYFVYNTRSNKIKHLTTMVRKNVTNVVEQMLTFGEKLLLVVVERKPSKTVVHYTHLWHDKWKEFIVNLDKEYQSHVAFALDDMIVFATWNSISTTRRILFQTVLVGGLQHGLSIDCSSRNRNLFTYTFEITFENTVPFANKLHSFHRDMLYVYDPQQDSLQIRPSGIEVQENDAIYSIPNYQESFYVVLRRRYPNKYCYYLWKVGQSEFIADFTMDVDPKSEPAVLVQHIH